MTGSEVTIKRAQGSRHLEALCTKLFGTAGGTARCLVVASQLSDEPRTHTFTVGVGGEHALGVIVESAHTRMQRCDVILEAARNVARLEGPGEPEWIGLRDEPFRCNGKSYRIIMSRETGGLERVIIRATTPALSQLASHSPEGRDKNRALKVRVPVRIFIKTPEKPKQWPDELHIASSQWCLAVIDPWGTAMRAELADNNPRGVRMNGEKLVVAEFPVQVELGTLTMSSDNLLELRPDDEITVAGSLPMTGILRVCNEPWARVRIEQRGGELVLAVEELLGIEETFPQERRST